MEQKINDDSRGTYNTNKQIRFKISMLSSSWHDYSKAYTLVKGTITILNTASADAVANNTNKNVLFKNCEPFTCCISRINNTQIDDSQYIGVVMPMYNVKEYGDKYSKTSEILFQYYRDVQAVDNNHATIDFTEANVNWFVWS